MKKSVFLYFVMGIGVALLWATNSYAQINCNTLTGSAQSCCQACQNSGWQGGAVETKQILFSDGSVCWIEYCYCYNKDASGRITQAQINWIRDIHQVNCLGTHDPGEAFEKIQRRLSEIISCDYMPFTYEVFMPSCSYVPVGASNTRIPCGTGECKITYKVECDAQGRRYTKIIGIQAVGQPNCSGTGPNGEPCNTHTISCQTLSVE